MSDDDWLIEADEIAANVARQVHRKYTTYFDVADVRQELVAWCLRKEQRVREWLDPAQDTHGRKVGIKMLAKAMNREADKYCRSRKAKICGYDVADEFFYSSWMLEELIPRIMDRDDWLPPATTTNPYVSNGGSDPATGNNYLAMILDTRAAFEKLEPSDQMILTMKYVESRTLSDIALALGISDSSVSRRIHSALRRMVQHLGGENPWYTPRPRGGRKPAAE